MDMARLGLKARALAWLKVAGACSIIGPGRDEWLRLGLALPRPRPWLFI